MQPNPTFLSSEFLLAAAGAYTQIAEVFSTSSDVVKCTAIAGAAFMIGCYCLSRGWAKAAAKSLEPA